MSDKADAFSLLINGDVVMGRRQITGVERGIVT